MLANTASAMITVAAPPKRREEAAEESRGSRAGRSHPTEPDPPSIGITVFRSFTEAEATWRRAQEDCACYGFQTFEWLSTWQETIGEAQHVEPHLVHIADASGKTLMLLPLGIQRRLGLSFLNFLGGVVTDYNAPLVRADFTVGLDAEAVNQLLAWVLARLPHVDIVEFEKMPLMIDNVTNPFAGLPDAKHVATAHAAALGNSFEDFKKCRSAKLFTDTARRRRLLSQIAEPRFRIAESIGIASEILRVLARQKSRRWQESFEHDLFAEPGYLAFYSTLAERNLASGFVHISALQVGGTVVATHWGMVFRERFYYLIPGYEAGDWRRFSVGRLLMQSLVEWGISKGLREFDLTIGDESFKREWADHSLPLHDCVRALTGRAKIYLGCVRARNRLAEWAKQSERFRALVRRLRSRYRIRL